MGNGLDKYTSCIASSNHRRRRHDTAAVVSDDALGHSFCYVRPKPYRLSSSTKIHHKEESTSTITSSSSSSSGTTFQSISGASVSANTSTAPLSDCYPFAVAAVAASAFDCSDSFASVPLQPIPCYLSGPPSGTVRRGFMSGPIERGFMSEPVDLKAGLLSGLLDRLEPTKRFLQRSFSHGGSKKASFIRGMRWVVTRTITLGKNSVVTQIKAAKERGAMEKDTTGSDREQSKDGFDGKNLHWAQGKAGEDRVHVVISEEQGWVFIGIYDGFNGPNAPDYLLSNLYPAVERELKGLLWEDKPHGTGPSPAFEHGNDPTAIVDGPGAELATKEQVAKSTTWAPVNHLEVLKALSRALRKTEDSFLEAADKTVSENPELALMGSCVLVTLMKGDDMYLLNVGDSRAVLGRKPESMGAELSELWRIKEEDEEELDGFPTLAAVQLTLDHSTCVEEEVRRIGREHADDPSAVANHRVKGSLKLTRAFGAGFLKQPKWNDALLKTFQVDYVGTTPYITCHPSLRHHRVGHDDRFLILSSDGLYQYFTNETAVAEVEMFMAAFPDGDPAQHLVEEVLFRAARRAGMDFHELLDIQQGGDRRRYHDDVSVIVVSFRGSLWRSGV